MKKKAISFDPVKDRVNRAKHGLSLADAVKVFDDDDFLEISTIRAGDGEDRWKAIGLIEGRLHTAIYTWRGETQRFISFRRSNKGEERAYHGSFDGE